MDDNKRHYWFRSKYGFGWYPVTIQGGIVFLIYFAFLTYIFLGINKNSQAIGETLIAFAPFVFGATVILLFLCYLNGEPIKITKLKI